MDRSGLTQDYDAHAAFAFVPVPDAPLVANRAARLRRFFIIALGQSWLAVLLYRAKVALRGSHVPAAPAACDIMARALFRVQIGDAVKIGRGLMIPHGNVVIDGRVRIGRNCQINPWVTIGLSNSRRLGFSAEGPTIGDDVHVGTGAKIIGPIRVGDHARIGANAVVVDDVPANVTVVGVPARPVGSPARDWSGSRAAHVRDVIIDYKLRRRSLGSTIEVIRESVDGAGASDEVDASLARLQRAANAREDHTQEVFAALDAIESALGH